MILNLTSFAVVEKYCTERSGCCTRSRRKVRGDPPRVAAMSCQISLELLLELIRCGDREIHPKAVKALSCDQTLACVVAYGIGGGRFGG
jgi:hypothetical protein